MQSSSPAIASKEAMNGIASFFLVGGCNLKNPSKQKSPDVTWPVQCFVWVVWLCTVNGGALQEKMFLCVHLQGICLQSPPTHRVMYWHTETYRWRDAPVTQEHARSYMERPLQFFVVFFFSTKRIGDSDDFLTCVSDRVEQFGREQREKAELPRLRAQ